MDDIFDIDLVSDFGEEVQLEASLSADIPPPDAFFERSREYWMQVPIPAECVPRGDAPLSGIPDDVLLTMSPTLLMHVQRTAASGGLQVISPRAVPLAAAAAHTELSHRTTDMFIVGSVASRNMSWPVVSEPVPEWLFPEDPIDAYPITPAVRPKTVTTGIAASAKLVSDPVVRAFLIGRALVDLQRRPDVAGSGDLLASHIAASWGLDKQLYDGMAEASLAPMGSLLRYAVRSDDAYPMLNAPIHARKCITVGANTAGRLLYGEHAAIDWRRLRVLCEAVFYMSSRVEGHSLSAMALQVPPGDPRARPDRTGVLQMRPLPGSVWSHAPSTFRLDLTRTDPPRAAIAFPERVARAVAVFYSEARPAAIAAWAGESSALVPTMVRQPKSRTAEELVSGYHHVTGMASTFSARGKTSAAAVRDYVYQALTGNASLSAIRTLWLVRYLRETAVACGLGSHMDSTLVRQVASRLSDLVTDLRIRLAVESNRRGATLDDWWSDLTALLPREYASLGEGSASWAIAVAYFLLYPYSHKWSNLAQAIGFKSHQALAHLTARDVRLPAEVGSPARVFEAAAATCRSLAASYGAYYAAMYEVACILSAQLTRMGNPVAAYKVRVAGNMWDIRAKAASTVTLHRADGSPTHAGVVLGRSGPYHLTTAPYPAYQRWLAHMHDGRIVSMSSRRIFPHHASGPIEQLFVGRTDPLFPMGGQSTARLFRYSSCPAQLAADISRTLGLMAEDISATVEYYEAEHAPADAAPSLHKVPIQLGVTGKLPSTQTGSYWEMLPLMDPADATDTDDLLNTLPPDVQDEIWSATFDTPEAARLAVVSLAECRSEQQNATRDTVV